MDTSYVAVGTVMYMITDSLTCRPQKSSAERGAGANLKCDPWAAFAEVQPPRSGSRASRWPAQESPRRAGVASRHRAMVRVRMDLACYTLPLRSGAVVQAELISALLCWWRLAARPAVQYEDHD